MLQEKQQKLPIQPSQIDTKIQDFEQQTASQTLPLRHLQPSILNKSSIHSTKITDAHLQQLPSISINTQKLDISRNLIKMVPLGFVNLKEIRMNNNCIERLPQQINDMHCLRIICANNNKITVLPLLKNIRHLQLNNNPIRLISSKLSESRLQYLSFDWIPFLINTYFQHNDQAIVYALFDIIRQLKLQPDVMFVEFHRMFQKKKINFDIGYLLHKAVHKSMDFFIQFMLMYHSDINFNLLLYNDRPIIQYVLEQRYQKALQLFRLKRSNLNDPVVFIMNLLLACKYNHINFFNYVISNGLKRNIIQENQSEIIQTIYRSFDQSLQSGVMLARILYYAGFCKENKKVFHLPRNYSILQAENICQGLLYSLKDQNLRQILQFSQAVQNDLHQPLLHFSMNNRKPELTKIILQRYKKPFIKNLVGKQARTIRGSVFSRKLVWKYQKRQIKDQLQKQIQVYKTQRKSLTDEKWFSIIYNRIEQSKKKVVFNSPSILKNSNKSIHSSNNHNDTLFSSRIISFQKQIQSMSTINKLKYQRTKQGSPLVEISDNIGEIDHMGIISDYVINAKTGMFSSYNLKNKISSKMNNLIIYQIYHRSQTDIYQKDYQIKNQNSKQNNLSIFISPWNLCTGAQMNEQQFQTQQIYLQKMNKSNKKRFLRQICTSVCIQVNDLELEKSTDDIFQKKIK